MADFVLPSYPDATWAFLGQHLHGLLQEYSIYSRQSDAGPLWVATAYYYDKELFEDSLINLVNALVVEKGHRDYVRAHFDVTPEEFLSNWKQYRNHEKFASAAMHYNCVYETDPETGKGGLRIVDKEESDRLDAKFKAGLKDLNTRYKDAFFQLGDH